MTELLKGARHFLETSDRAVSKIDKKENPCSYGDYIWMGVDRK